MSRKPELSTAYARLTLQSGVAPKAELLRGVDIDEAELTAGEFIEASKLAVLFRNYDRVVGDCGWPARLGSQFNIAAHGPLGFAALSAPTLGEALDVMGNLYPSRNTAMTATTYATETHYVLQIEDATGEQGFDRWLVEVILKIIEMLLASIIGHSVDKNVLISFAHEAPANCDRLLAEFNSKVSFGAAGTTIAVPLSWRQLPSPLHDESVYRTNVIKCRELIAEREQSGSAAFYVRSHLSNHFDSQLLRVSQASPPPTLEEVATAMHLTPRTLIRKLRREDTAYREELESLRRAFAERLLQDARLKIADIAEILGYREAANFSRAFQRWYHISPAAWRRR